MSDDDDKPDLHESDLHESDLHETQPLDATDLHVSEAVRVINLDNDDRVETGPVKFVHESGYEDWTGIYLRGDTSMGYVMYLRGLIESLEERLDLQDEENSAIWFYIMMTEGLIDLLQECYEGGVTESGQPIETQDTEDDE